MFTSPVFKIRTSPTVRSACDVRRWRKALTEKREEILAALRKDTGKHESEGYWMEWVPIEGTLSFLEQNIDEMFRPSTLESSMGLMLGRRYLVQRRIPLGHVLIVGTWNFPLSLHLTQILFAAAAGNKVTFKASNFSPELGRTLGRILPDILGKELFQEWVPDSDAQVIERIRKGDFNLVIFTGGTTVAKIYAHACADAMIPLIAEASGSESVVVLDTALGSSSCLTRTVDHLVWATFHHTGQTCVTPRYWFVPRSHLESVYESATKILDSEPDAVASRSPLQHERIVSEHQGWEKWALGLNGVQQFRSKLRPEFSIVKLPEVKHLPTDNPGTFGPAAMIVGYDKLEDVVTWICKSPWSLLTTVMGHPGSREMDLLSDIDTTIVSLNEAVTAAGDAAIAFGGRGASGYGVCHGLDGLRAMSRVQTWQEVRAWPGAGLLKATPSWSSMARLKKFGLSMRELNKSPLKAIKNIFS